MFVRLLLTAMLATTLVSAQGGKKRGGSGMGGGMPVQRPSKLEEFADRLKLTKEQKVEVQTLLSAAMEESAPLRDQMDKGRVAIAGAMIEGKSGDDLKKMLDEKFEPFTFSPTGASVYHLGNFGTARQQLKTWELKP